MKRYKGSITDAGIRDFFAIFASNRNKYVKHLPPFKEEGTKMKASRVFYVLDADKQKKPVTIDDFRAHLNGEYGVAVEPLRDTQNDKGIQRNMCFYCLIDIDVYDKSFFPMIQSMYRHGLKFCAVRSKSGGLHIYFMFQNAEKAKDARDMLRRIVDVFGMDKIYCGPSGSKVEIFPMHDAEAPGSDGKCVFLPYYNVAGAGTTNYMYGADGSVINFADALESIKRNYTSVREMNEVLDRLPYSDAPYCIQAIALSNSLGENEGRNKFMFHSCVYLKKKFGAKTDSFKELLELDKYLASPLQDEQEGMKELQDTYNSAMSKDWAFSCKQEPMCNFCNKELCTARKFSGVVKRGTDNINTGADFLGPISRVLARVPYYLWEIAPPGKPAKEVRFDNISELASQSIVQQKCWDQLGWAPLPIKVPMWVETVNTCMEGIEDRQITVSEESDTSELSELHSLIVGYLTHAQVQNGAEYMVNVGQVFVRDGKYYFTTDGVKTYLRVQKFNLGRTNLREELMSFGCTEGELSYTGRSGRTMQVKCWVKEEDAELAGRQMYYDDILEQDADRAKDLKLTSGQPAEQGGVDYSDEAFRF